MNTQRGLIKDVEKTVVELCRDAFAQDEYLGLNVGRPAADQFHDMDIMNATIQDLPAVFVWVDNVTEDVNETGSLGGRKQRETLTFRVYALYVTHSALDKEGSDDVREIGWQLKEKLTANVDLDGLVNKGGRLIALNFEPEVLIKDNQLIAANTVRLALEYEVSRARERVTKYGG